MIIKSAVATGPSARSNVSFFGNCVHFLPIKSIVINSRQKKKQRWRYFQIIRSKWCHNKRIQSNVVFFFFECEKSIVTSFRPTKPDAIAHIYCLIWFAYWPFLLTRINKAEKKTKSARDFFAFFSQLPWYSRPVWSRSNWFKTICWSLTFWLCSKFGRNSVEYFVWNSVLMERSQQKNRDVCPFIAWITWMLLTVLASITWSHKCRAHSVCTFYAFNL